MTQLDAAPDRTTIWPDLLALALGLAIPWFSGWTTTDLVWSLWLSSLVIGYARVTARIVGHTGANAAGTGRSGETHRNPLTTYLAFTLHFGLVHYGFAKLLAEYFPLHGADGSVLSDGELLAVIVLRYAIFLPAALLAERSTLQVDHASAGHPSRADAREAYSHVVRISVLVLLLGMSSVADLNGFAVYAAVYTVAVLPWRALRGRRDVGLPVREQIR